MRTSYRYVSSARRLSSWLMALLGLAAYVGLTYALILVPLQLEVPLPTWSVPIIPPVIYGLLVLLWVRRPSVLRWLVGTALLSGLHLLLEMAREPLTALLDPALAGRPLPWVLPPPLPELIGVMLLLVPLRDVLRAPVRLARERMGGGRSTSSHRGRPVAAPRAQMPPAAAGSGSLSETLLGRSEPVAEPATAPAAPPAPPPPPLAPVAPVAADQLSRPRAAARPERRAETRPLRPSRSDVVLRIALDRIMGQLPPGTFLAPEDEVAASLSEPGYLRVSGELVVTQLSEGVARIAWHDIAAQFPSRLVGLSDAEISEHLGDGGLRLPLDEVIGQLPHELFVADTPEIEVPGLDRIPVPFQPLKGPDPTSEHAVAAEAPRAVVGTAVPPAVEPAPPVAAPAAAPAAVKVPPAPPVPAEAAVPPVPEPIRRPEPSPADPTPAGADEPPAAADEPMVRVSFGRVAGEIPTEAFHVPLEQVAGRMRQPGSLLIPQSVIVPQLAEGLIQVSWSVVAPQFPRDQMAVSDEEMTERLPNGIRLPLDEVIRQVPPDLFMPAGPAADVRGLESFPAPFQPLLSDPAPEAPPPPAAAVVEPLPVPEPAPMLAAPEPAPDLVVSAAPEPSVIQEPVAERAPEAAEAVRVVEPVEPDPSLAREAKGVLEEPEPLPVVAPAPAPVSAPEPPPAPEARWEAQEAVQAAPDWPEPVLSSPVAGPSAAGPAETAEARRIVALLAPIASFDVSVQTVEGITVFAMASPTVAQETAAAAAGLTLPLLTDRRPAFPVDQITLRGPETALVLTPLGAPAGREAVLAAAAPRGGALALLEILCRRAAGDRGARSGPAAGPVPVMGGLAPAAVSTRVAGLSSSLTAFGSITASVLRDAESEAVLYFFLPAGGDVPAVGAFAQDLHAVMRKAAGSGAVFRTAIVRSGDTLLVIQPEEIGHGRSILIVAGGSVTRPGLAYRQVERASATLMSA